MALTFDPKQEREMIELQIEIQRVLVRANERKMEAAVAAFACIRAARILLDKYPPKTNAFLLDTIEAFLRHDIPTDPVERTGPGIIFQ